MSFKFHEDRGTILRITFDIVYPNGQMKSVAMSMADYDEFGDAMVIALNQEGVEKVIQPALTAAKLEINATNLYNTKAEGELTKPAILIMNKDGKVVVKCGAHHSSGHMEKGNAVARFM